MPSSDVFRKFGAGELHSGGPNGPVVKNRQQAVAIMESERRAEKANGGHYPEKHGPQSTGAKGHNPGSALRGPDGRTMEQSGLGTPGAGGGKVIASIAKRSTLKPRKTLMGHKRHEDSIALPAPAKEETSAPAKPAGYVPGLDDDEGEDYHTVMGGLAKTLFHALHRR